jgi:hypothetical protein
MTKSTSEMVCHLPSSDRMKPASRTSEVRTATLSIFRCLGRNQLRTRRCQPSQCVILTCAKQSCALSYVNTEPLQPFVSHAQAAILGRSVVQHQP